MEECNKKVQDNSSSREKLDNSFTFEKICEVLKVKKTESVNLLNNQYNDNYIRLSNIEYNIDHRFQALFNIIVNKYESWRSKQVLSLIEQRNNLFELTKEKQTIQEGYEKLKEDSEKEKSELVRKIDELEESKKQDLDCIEFLNKQIEDSAKSDHHLRGVIEELQKDKEEMKKIVGTPKPIDVTQQLCEEINEKNKEIEQEKINNQIEFQRELDKYKNAFEYAMQLLKQEMLKR